MEIKTTLLSPEQLKPLYNDPLKLGFGKKFSDYMFLMKYTKDKGWHDAEIKPYGHLPMDPAAMVFHYGQEIFEGQKAYKSPSGDILLFRPQENAKRLNRSAERMCIPQIPEADILKSVLEMVKIDARWIPAVKGTSLYVRPTIIASEAALGVRAATEYLYYIILAPSGPFFKEGFNPVSLWVSREYARAGAGGTGAAKAGGNYGGSLLAGKLASEKGYSQVLWLDAKEHRFAEEVGAMNIFFIKENKLITPPLTGTILPGITRKSVMEMAGDLGITAEEKQITIEEIAEGIDTGKITEVFGAGTAAVISPVGKINIDGEDYLINNNKTGPWANKFYETLTDYQYGLAEDPYGWVYRVED